MDHIIHENVSHFFCLDWHGLIFCGCGCVLFGGDGGLVSVWRNLLTTAALVALDWLVLSSPLLQLQLYAVDTRWSTRAPTTTWSRPTATCPTRTGCSCPRPWATLARDPSPWQCRRVRSPHGDPTTCSPWTVWPMPWWIWMSRWYSDLIKHLDGGRYFSMSRNYEQLKDILLWIAGWKRTTSTASTTLDSGTTAENPLIQII